MRIYTRRGDAGQTDLIGGPRVGKSHPRVEAFGCVDELNAAIGWALACCEDDATKSPLITAQHRLFDIGAHLASPIAGPIVPDDPGQLGGSAWNNTITAMERQMDAVEDALEPLRAFILPGGGELASRLHVARTVCRRAERRVVELAEHQPVAPNALTYLNRLSDLLFVLARQANRAAGRGDVCWAPIEAEGPSPTGPSTRPDPPA